MTQQNASAEAVDGRADVVAGEPKSPRLRAAYRGRLFRKYLLLILSLVGGALLVSSATSLYFTYQENKSALAELQHEKALAAASRIEQYIRTIEQQLKYAALPQLDVSDVELRRIEFLKLLRQAPEVTDVAQLDATGREQIAVSRLGMDVAASGKDRSQEPAFREAKRAQTWFGPVYFRKETEPYMTMSIRSGGSNGPVTIADVNLKFIWDVVSRIKIGEKGKAYVVDRNGYLIADPDIGLVLRKTDLSQLAHVKAGNAAEKSAALAMASTDLAGTQVLASVAPIAPLGWNVFVEQPVAEVYEKLNASIQRSGLLLLAGLVISALVALALARSMVRPIRTLSEGAQRIGEGDLDQKIDVRTGDELEALGGQFNRMTSRLKESYAGLERKVEERTHALQNSLEQQTAISEILRVISSSPTDVKPVLDAVAERAAHLCNAPFARVLLVDGDTLRFVTEFSAEREPLPQPPGPIPLERSVITGRAALDRETIHHADIVPLLDTEYPDSRASVLPLGARAVLSVPLIREGGAYGGIFLFRREPGLFSPDQVALVETFARQAAIAIDNVRLFNQTKEALEQQTAISEILRVISSSPTDVQPVLAAVAERAAHLCDAPTARVLLIDGEVLRPAAQYSADSASLPDIQPTLLKRTSINGRAAIDRATVHVADVVPLFDTEFPDAKENALTQGLRSVLAVPLLREGGAYGTILLWRREARPFSPSQITLVETFARQAAIAIENVRLFNETKEALAQQTAISEILRVISSSPTDVRPMLNAVAERALTLCDAAESGIFLVDGDALRFATHFGTMSTFVEGDRQPLTRGLVVGRATIDRETLHYTDIVPLLDTEFPDARPNQQKFGFRAILCVPLMREDRAIGAFTLWRSEPRAFTDKQIALVKTFADQAAIAIENVRLFNETKEGLEQQTAISEILRVISGSPTDVLPVLDAIAERAARLCDAASASMYLTDGNMLRHLASKGPNAEPVTHLESFPIDGDSISGRAILDQKTMNIPDLLAKADQFPLSAEIALRYGHRTVIVEPLFREGKPFGTIVLRRLDVRPFSDREVALLRTFGDQAAIALENVRLFNETREALERQTATSEILRVISESPTDVQPVLDAVAKRAGVLCRAEGSRLWLLSDGQLRAMTSYGPAYAVDSEQKLLPLRATSIAGRAVLERRIVHVEDVLPLIETEYPDVRELQQRYGFRTVLNVPLLREGEAIGVLSMFRNQVRPFLPVEISLLQTFADQAVIAIENSRLFNETKEALDQQRASGEVLAAISSSIADTKPVFDVILQSCQRLFAGETVGVTLVRDDGMLDIGGRGPEFDELKKLFPQPLTPDTSSGLAILERRVLVYTDIESEDMPEKSRAGCRAIGTQSIVFAPMLFEGRGIGTLWVGRPFKGAFSDKQIALLKTFAEQAVIAIQNARLFTETKEALERQTAIADILQVISSSVADTSPVFEKILDSCEHLFATEQLGIFLVRDGQLHVGAFRGDALGAVVETFPKPIDETATGIALRERRTVHIPDAIGSPGVPASVREVVAKIGNFSVAWAPMLWEDEGVGSIAVLRRPPSPFSEKEIALLKTFADQAVIAIQNARLFNETKEALEQQRASGEVLAAISSSIADTKPVFERILTSCERLFGVKLVQINLVGEDGLVRLGGSHMPGLDTIEKMYPFPLDKSSSTGVAIMTRSVAHFPDIEHANDVPVRARIAWRAMGLKAAMTAPMLWEGKGIGSLVVGRDYAGPFSEKEIALLKTFADQAVIAIQNARLFNETKEALDQQRASADVLAAISSSIADTTPVFDRILMSCERLFTGRVISINLLGEDGRVHMAAYHGPEKEKLNQAVYGAALGDRESGTERAIARRAVLHYPDVANDADVPAGISLGAAAVGMKAGIVAPMMWEGKGIGAIVVGRDYVGPFSEKEIALLKTFADQAVIAIQNARLFREIQDKSRQLETANKHKSEFLANMSHELRTPLNAIIGFSEVLIERFFGEVNEKQDDYLKDIHSSGRHLLSLINDILDLSKIEAGRMELEPTLFNLPAAVDNAMTLIRERAQRHNVALSADVDVTVGEIVADERKFKQILLNLLSNAVKFTPDGGRIDVMARRADGHTVIAVRDTGVGIAAQDQAAVFEEFRQVGSDYTKKQEGTGLGLALTRKFVELHGGRIWLESEPGKGSTFSFTIPTRQ